MTDNSTVNDRIFIGDKSEFAMIVGAAVISIVFGSDSAARLGERAF
jgi:hypothetical protein